jgi:hypothetical protein
MLAAVVALDVTFLNLRLVKVPDVTQPDTFFVSGTYF